MVDAFREAGLFGLLVPARLGGGERSPQEFISVIEAVAEADGAAAWCLMIGATTGILSAYLPEPEAREIFRPGAITGGVYAPLGTAEPAPGGWRVSGRWPFASGCQHCDWLLGGARVESGPPRLMFFPSAEVEIIDTWEVSGLMGTGSNDIAVKDLEVPAARSVALTADLPLHPGRLYAFPVFGLLALGIASVALGIARGAIDDLLDLAGAKTPTGSRRKLAERPLVQATVAEAEAILSSARAFVFEAVEAAWEAAGAGTVLELAPRARLRLAATHATIASARVVDLMYSAGGGTSIYRTSPLQRRFRDVHTATQHVMVAPPTLELSGRVLLGLETDVSAL